MKKKPSALRKITRLSLRGLDVSLYLDGCQIKFVIYLLDSEQLNSKTFEFSIGIGQDLYETIDHRE